MALTGSHNAKMRNEKKERGMKIEFYKLAIGARFFYMGKLFKKEAMSCAEDLSPDGKRWGHAFHASVEVEPDGEPLLLPPEVAAQWDPNRPPVRRPLFRH